jgi:hypothetical protein
MKELPYFKFYTNEWITGDVTFLDYETQGLFINLCAYYWSKDANLTLTNAKRKFSDVKPDSFNLLIESDIIKINEDNIIITFLDEQRGERGKLSTTNSKNGAKGGRPKKRMESEIKPNALFIESETLAKKSNIEEKRREEKKNIPLTPKGEVIDFDILLQTYNKIYNKKCVIINDKVKEKYKILLKQGYTKSNIHTAMLNCKNDKLHKESDFKYCSIGYFSRPNTMDLHGTELITEKKGIVGTYTIHDHD